MILELENVFQLAQLTLSTQMEIVLHLVFDCPLIVMLIWFQLELSEECE